MFSLRQTAAAVLGRDCAKRAEALIVKNGGEDFSGIFDSAASGLALLTVFLSLRHADSVLLL